MSERQRLTNCSNWACSLFPPLFSSLPHRVHPGYTSSDVPFCSCHSRREEQLVSGTTLQNPHTEKTFQTGTTHTHLLHSSTELDQENVYLFPSSLLTHHTFLPTSISYTPLLPPPQLLSHLSVPDEGFLCMKAKAKVKYLGMFEDGEHTKPSAQNSSVLSMYEYWECAHYTSVCLLYMTDYIHALCFRVEFQFW